MSRYAREYSKWDTIRLPYSRAEAMSVEVPTDIRVLRSRVRVQLCHSLLHLEPKLEGRASTAEEERLNSIITHRQDWWKQQVAPNHMRMSLGLATLLGTLMWLWIGWEVLLVLVGIGLLLGYVVQHPKRVANECVLSIQGFRCPDCNYPLNTVLPAFTGPARGCGPKACPECGSPWPLVPPPVAPGDTVDGCSKT